MAQPTFPFDPEDFTFDPVEQVFTFSNHHIARPAIQRVHRGGGRHRFPATPASSDLKALSRSGRTLRTAPAARPIGSK
jgi:hypothetical protein